MFISIQTCAVTCKHRHPSCNASTSWFRRSLSRRFAMWPQARMTFRMMGSGALVQGAIPERTTSNVKPAVLLLVLVILLVFRAKETASASHTGFTRCGKSCCMLNSHTELHHDARNSTRLHQALQPVTIPTLTGPPPRPSIYPLVDPKSPSYGTIYPDLRVE